MSDKPEILSFDEWYKEAKKLNIDGFSAKDFFEAGQQSKQYEIDELQERIDEVIYDLQHIESVMWEEQVEHVLMILKGGQV